ncbi:hypothetical protein [Bradyrhizobium sp. RT3a]
MLDFVAQHRLTVGNPLREEGLDATLTSDGSRTWVDTISFNQWKAGD